MPELVEPLDGPRANEFTFDPDMKVHTPGWSSERAMGIEHQKATTPEAARKTRRISVDIPIENWTNEVDHIFQNYLPGILQLFAAKSKDYTNGDGVGASDSLGVPGQWLKLRGKVDKLKRPLWDERGEGEEFQFESVQEVLSDIVGHVFLAKLHYERARAKVEGKWSALEEQKATMQALKEAAAREYAEKQNERIRDKVEAAREALQQALFEASAAQEVPAMNIGAKQ
jgi:hypothetical protein